RPWRLACYVASCSRHCGAPAAADISPLSLHDALPICAGPADGVGVEAAVRERERDRGGDLALVHRSRGPCAGAGHGRTRTSRSRDRKSTRLNSSHVKSSYAVFCLQKKRPRCTDLASTV